MKIEVSNTTVMLIFLLLLTLFLTGIYMKYKQETNTLERDYYKDQMILFCEISEIYTNKTNPNMYPCEKWLVGK